MLGDTLPLPKTEANILSNVNALHMAFLLRWTGWSLSLQHARLRAAPKARSGSGLKR